MQPFRILRMMSVLTLPVIGIAGAASAWAADDKAALGPGYSEQGAPLGPSTELRIDLRGEVPARCRMTSPPSMAGRLDFNRSGDVQSRFGLDCNAPFRLAVRSGQGGFASQGVQDGVARLIPYELAVDIDTDAGRNALGWCRSAQLSDRQDAPCVFGGEGWSSGDATAINRMGSLAVRWNAPVDGAEPVLGQYRDTIVVDVAVRS